MASIFPFSNKYEWEKRIKLGQGGFATVYKVKNRNSNDYVAVKEMDMSLIYESDILDALKTEIQLMKNLKGQHLIVLKDFQVGREFTYIILELCDGDLRKKMEENNGKLKQEEAIDVFSQIIKGFKCMVDSGYIHRDIKPENILYKNKTYKVADYGFSCKADMRYIKKLDLMCGTPLYMSPQLLKSQPYTAKSDIWSLGIMLFQMIFGYSPWVCRDLLSYTHSILSQPLAFPYNGKIGQNTKDFIRKCLVVDQTKRIGWKELFQHPLIQDKNKGSPVFLPHIKKSAVDIMKRIQQSATKKNISLRDILQARNIQRMDERLFFDICRLVDPAISSFEVRTLFSALDTSKDGIIDYNEFKGILLQNDFRDSEDIASRYIRELVEVAKLRKIDVKKLFQIFDRDNSGAIDKNQLARMVRQMLPKMSDEVIDKIWKKFDQDQNSKISLKEFIQEITSGSGHLNNPLQFIKQKTQRCLKSLRTAILYYNVSVEDLVQIFDRNGDSYLNIREFKTMVIAICKQLPDQQINLMFSNLDSNKNGKISICELKSLLY